MEQNNPTSNPTRSEALNEFLVLTAYEYEVEIESLKSSCVGFLNDHRETREEINK